jgi:hypothetical protein
MKLRAQRIGGQAGAQRIILIGIGGVEKRGACMSGGQNSRRAEPFEEITTGMHLRLGFNEEV